MFCVNQWNSGITGVCRKISGEGDAPTLLPPAHATVVTSKCCGAFLGTDEVLHGEPGGEQAPVGQAGHLAHSPPCPVVLLDCSSYCLNNWQPLDDLTY